MTRLSNLTLRNALIATHDALATVLALFASFYLRFEGSESFFDRVPLLLRILPYFVAFSVVVCYVFNLTTTKWRFISLPDALNILRVATMLTLALLVLDYIFVAPNVHGSFFLGKVTIVLYWFLEVFFLSALRFAYRYFRYTRVRRHARTDGASPTLLIGRAADAEILLRGIESGAVTRLWPVGVLSPSMADRGQSIRNVPVLGGIDDIEDVIRDFARRDKPIARVVMTPSAFDPEAHPEAVLMRARRLGLIVSRLPSLESGDAPRLTTVAVEDLLLRSSVDIDYARLEALVSGKAVIVTGGGGSIGSEICERVATFGAARLLVIENSEPALYAVMESLAEREIKRGHRRPHRRYSRPRTHAAADEGVQAEYRVSRRRPQACADPRARLERRRQDQHLRIGQCRRCGAGRGRRGDGDDFDRQGDRTGLDARPDQAVCRDVLPGARSRSGSASRMASRGCG